MVDEREAEIVITAPEPYSAQLAYAVRARTTLGVLVGLFAEAEEHVVISAPFLQIRHIAVKGILAVAMRAALSRGVAVDILTTRANLDLPEIRELAAKHRPRVRLFHAAFPSAETSEIGSHAKFCIRDRSVAYVGSANLTSPALGGAALHASGTREHFELGVLLRGPAAVQLFQIWQYMVRFEIVAEISHRP